MTDITELSNQVINTIHETDEYIAYIETRNELRKDPALYERVNEFRAKNFLLQQADSDDLLDMMDALTNEYEDVINIELVSEFITAEVALCRLVQEFNHRLIDGLDFD